MVVYLCGLFISLNKASLPVSSRLFDNFDNLGGAFVGAGLHAAPVVVHALDGFGRVEKENAAVQHRRMPEVAHVRRVHLARRVLLLT